MGKTPQQRIKELEFMKHKAGILDTLIDVAEEEFGFEIRKKSLPKQSKNIIKKDK